MFFNKTFIQTWLDEYNFKKTVMQSMDEKVNLCFLISSVLIVTLKVNAAITEISFTSSSVFQIKRNNVFKLIK